jgi:hypothetical protein
LTRAVLRRLRPKRDRRSHRHFRYVWYSTDAQVVLALTLALVHTPRALTSVSSGSTVKATVIGSASTQAEYQRTSP